MMKIRDEQQLISFSVKINSMTNENIQDNYSTFAEKYDTLFNDEMYYAWAGYVVNNTQPGRILDLGGGAGRLAVLLSQQNYSVDVLDISTEMLSLAQKHAADSDVDVKLLQADMREWSDWELRYPTIVSFADALNYLPNLVDFKATIRQVYDHLEAGGQFLFDVITPYQINVLYNNYYYNNDDDEENIFMWTSYPGETPDSVDHDLKFFVYDENIDGFRILREIHHEQTYTLSVFQRELELAGFEDITVSADFGNQTINDTTERWFFRAVKA
ncbi:methyltransferase [Leuconostoc gelidum subsp. gelidum]|nr:methyltransferase [Leuconostoc gelidum subsp. gelidum]